MRTKFLPRAARSMSLFRASRVHLRLTQSAFYALLAELVPIGFLK